MHFITVESEVAFDFAHHPIRVFLMIAQISSLNLNHAMKFITIILLEAYDTPYNWAEALLNCCFLSRINVSMKILLSPLKTYQNLIISTGSSFLYYYSDMKYNYTIRASSPRHALTNGISVLLID